MDVEFWFVLGVRFHSKHVVRDGVVHLDLASFLQRDFVNPLLDLLSFLF